MDKKTKKWIMIIIKCIEEIQKDYNSYKGMILTEGDLECELYSRLKNNKEFSQISNSKNISWKTGFIHSQVTWFKPNKESGFEVDLTILNPEKLDIQTFELSRDYPNKGFFYDGEAVAIELKFIREPSEHKSKIRNSANVDYIKIIDELIEAKKENIKEKKYFIANLENTAFISVVGCKTDEIYEIVKETLIIATQKRKCPNNVIPIIFSHNEFYIFNSEFQNLDNQDPNL
jgi:hypothetical protein